jgi:Fe-Mn family superoxide dismutase
MVFKQVKLPCGYSDLEPVIDTDTMHFHYDKHHKAYTDKFNKAVMDEKLGEFTAQEIFARVSNYSKAVRNNGGGWWNHNFFFEALSSEKQNPSKKMLKLINDSFGSYEKFKEQFSQAAATCFGSGWAWLGLKDDGELEIYSTANQDNALMDICEFNSKPILNLDVWEHAYYLKYKNARPEWIENFFEIINWKKVEKRLN